MIIRLTYRFTDCFKSTDCGIDGSSNEMMILIRQTEAVLDVLPRFVSVGIRELKAVPQRAILHVQF